MKLSGRLKLTLLAGALALFFLAVLVGVLPSVLVNRPETRDLIRRHAAEALGGEVDFGAIRLALLPHIRASVAAPRAATADGIRFSAEEISVSLQFWPLLYGRVEPDAVSLQAPVVRLPVAPVPAGEGPPSLPDPRQILAAAAAALGPLPDVRLTAARGRVELAAADGTVFQIQDIDLELACRGGEIELTAAARSDLVHRLAANARLQAGPFTGSARLRLEGLRPERPYAFFFPGRAFRILDTEANLDLTVELDGPQRLQARANAGFPRLSAGWKDGAATLADARVAATLELNETRMALRVPELVAATPQVSLALGWVVDSERSPRIEITLEGSGDAEQARAAALPFLVDIEEGALVCGIVRGGQTTHIRVAMSGDTVGDFERIESLTIEGRLEKGRIDLPFIRFDAEEVSGDFRIRDGFLEADGIRARRKGLSTAEGRLRLQLRPDNQSLTLELPLAADDLSVLPGLLGRMIDDPDFQRELKRIQAIEGSTAGRLRIGGQVPDVTIDVEAWQIDARGRHAAVPYPLAFQGGRIAYSRDAVTLQGVDVSVGRSQASRLDAAVGLTGARRLRAASPRAAIDLGEAHAWLEQVGPVAGLRGLAGSWQMNDWRVDGPLDRPEAWNVAAAGGLSSVVITADPLPSPVQVPSGTLAWQGQRLRLSDLSPTWGRSTVAGLSVELDWSGPLRVGLQAARAALSVEDVLPALLTQAPALRAQIEPLLPLAGTIGLHTIRADVRIPASGPQLASASAVIANASVASARLADPLVLGSGTVALDGPRLAVADLDAAFGRSEARGLSLAATDGGGVFVEVAAADIDLGAVFAAVAELPAVGDLRRYVAGVSGTLSLSNVVLSAPTPQRPRWVATAEADLWDLTVESALLEAPLQVASARLRASETVASDARTGALVRMEPARVRSGHNDLTVGGTLTLVDGETAFDLDVAAESLDWDEIYRAADRIASRRAGGDRPAALKGRLRLHADQFAFYRFRIAPLRATAEFGEAGTAVLIDLARLCGMDLIGRIGVDGPRLDLFLVPVVDGASLDLTVPCLTQESSLVGGTFNLNGELYASGSSDALLNALKGELTVTADNGVIRRSLFFARILSLLNLTEIYRGHFPDLRNLGIKFQRAAARAEVRDGKVLIPEWSIFGHTFWMGSRGEIDLATQQIDFTVMVSPFKTADRIINSIPGLRWILGGRLVAIPMRATGHIDDPRIVPLSPTAVGTSILDMMKRTLMLPIQIIQPLVPGMEEQGNTTITR